MPGVVNWSVSGGGAVNPASGSSTLFIAGNSAATPTVKATLPDGQDIPVNFTVVEPGSESATKTDLTFPAGQQGVGMSLTITVAPIDVSFKNVEMLEIPGPASAILGYFTDTRFAGTDFSHHPNVSWIPLNAENKWGDTASFNGWPTRWSAGGYDWDIPVTWRVIGDSGSGNNLPHNRLQQHRIVDNTGLSTESKLGQTASRSP